MSLRLKLSDREVAAVLVGLRLLQNAEALDVFLEDVATDGGRFERLSVEELDGLCRRVNQA